MHYLHAVYAFLVATVVAAVLTPFAGRLARRVGAISYPSDRGLARKPTPELGGLAILAGVILAAAIWLPAKIPLQRAQGEAVASVVHTWTVLGGAMLIALVGAIDDAIDLNPLLKLIGQIGAAVIATAGGAVIKGLTLPFVHYLAFPDGGKELTVIWLVALMNIVNFSDGVDGLAGGVCTIDGAAFSVIAFKLHGSAAAVLAALTAGGALGFLFHNRYPAKIFMGDTGSNLLGYLLGVVAVIGSLKTNAVVALAVPLLVLAVPFMDTGFVVAKRLKYRRAPWQADDEHFHHRMARIGFSAKKTVAYLYTWTLMLAGVALALQFVPYKNHDSPGHYHLGWSIVMGAILLFALIASVYLVYVLEIFKFKSLRAIQLRKVDPDTSEIDIVKSVERDIETGEFDALRDAPGPEPDDSDDEEAQK